MNPQLIVNRLGLILGIALATAIIFALLTGNINNFNNTYIH